MEARCKAAPPELERQQEDIRCWFDLLLRTLDVSTELVWGTLSFFPHRPSGRLASSSQTAASDSARKEYGISRTVGYFVFTSL